MHAGNIESVNVGRPRTVVWGGRQVTTGIFKEPVMGRVRVKKLGLEGDGQADPRFHGGPFKAVYAYPGEHYSDWSRELGNKPLAWGAFGENLTTRGLLESSVQVGDVFEAGTALLRVTGPRVACFKLAKKFGSPDFVRLFAQSRRSGFYLEVLREGTLAAGDAVRRFSWVVGSPSIMELASDASGE